jgi:protein TonB
MLTFSDAPMPLGHNDPTTPPFTDPVARDLLKPLPADFAPPRTSTSLSTDLTVGPADLPAPTGPAVPPPPDRTARPTPLLSDAPGSAAAATDQRPPDALRNPSASTVAPSASATPQGTPDVPPTPSSRNKVPPYPPDALRRRLAGTVLLELHIADTGRVTDAVIQQSSGHDLLDASARDTALTWTFTPARLDGRPVAITVLRPVNFIPPR